MIFSGSVRKAKTVAGGAAIWVSRRTMSSSVIGVSLIEVGIEVPGGARRSGRRRDDADASSEPGCPLLPGQKMRVRLEPLLTRQLKLVRLFHALPGHRHSAARQLIITSAREFLLCLEQLQPGRKPLFTCCGLVVGHGFSPLVGAALFPAVELDVVWRGSAFPGFEKRLQAQQEDRPLGTA